MNPLDPDEFRRQGHMTIDFLADYHTKKSRNLTHWQSPNFFAYFPSSFGIPGMLGEMLCTRFNEAGFNWFSSPAVTELENLVMDWLGKLVNLPTPFLFSGHDKILRRLGHDSITKLVIYGSDQTHCSFQKAAQIVGIDPQNFRAIKTTRSTSFDLSPDTLREAIYSDIEAGLIPLYSCAPVGTISITAVDPLTPLCKITDEFGMWVHLDAAYAGASCICPEYRKSINGVEFADSFSFDDHRWLLTPPDCSCLWLKDPKYLKKEATDSKQVVDHNDWQLSLSRRLRAVKLWLLFGELVEEDGRSEIAFQICFAMICFRNRPSTVFDNMTNGHALENRHGEAWKAEEWNRINARLLQAINASGQAFMTHAVVGGIYAIWL
ncbi:hypothetical protein EUGRSUZ_E02461 [Eucalyptus grandis]|uniref:Uncharacterized protein n=2 Tax=Eucalyptus grandis TaxID=71139 RepID=A0A059C680_EUCGR|nr:hypothetical protein EUGRSUZ_E02461 [Eucalyptus grandis]